MAASADEVIVKLQDMVECPVCLGHFEEPRMLLCQHSFCTKCLQGLLGTRRKIRCPCCNKETPVPNSVRELPVDFRANTQLEILSGYEKGQEVQDAEAPQDEPFEVMTLDECCPVCEEIPTVSKNLSCGHRLCENCVQFLLPVGGDSLHCPTCSRPTRIATSSNTDRKIPSPWNKKVKSSPRSRLTFHPQCGKNVVIHANSLTAHRNNPMECMAGAAVCTSRHLQPGEVFEVRLDKMVDKWGCSMKIGVATTCPGGSAPPTDVYQQGPWWMSGCKVQNGSTIVKQYEQDLFKLKVGDRVGVQRRVDQTLHFYVNGADLGVAAFDVPAHVYGVINVCGSTTQVTITDTSAPTITPSRRSAAPPIPTLQDASSCDLTSVSATPQPKEGQVSLMDRIKRMLTKKKTPKQ